MKTLLSLIGACAVLAFVSSAFGGTTIKDTSAGVTIGVTTNEKVAFHGATPTVQRAGSAQAALSTNMILGSTVDLAGVDGSTNSVFLVNSNQLQGILRLLIEIRAAGVEKGLIRGN